MPKPKQPKEVIEDEVSDVFALQKTLEETEKELMANEQFRKFLDLQKSTQEQIAKVWSNIERQMLEHDVKSIKGDWGSITIAERINWEYDPTVLPSKFFKKVVDTKKLSDTFRLEGKEPKGATAKYIKYLTKRIK